MINFQEERRELEGWKESNEEKAVKRIEAYVREFQNNLGLDHEPLNLAGLKLRKLPLFLFTNPIFKKVDFSNNPLESLPEDLLIGSIVNIENYEEALKQIANFPYTEERIESRIVNRENQKEIADFLLRNIGKYPKITSYLGFIVASGLQGSELRDLLESLKILDKELLDSITRSIFLHTPSSLEKKCDILRNIIEIAFKVKNFFIFIKLISYYAFEVLLKEEIYPLKRAGLASFYIIEYTKAAAFIASFLKKLEGSSGEYEESIRSMKKYLSLIVDALDKSVDVAPFLSSKVLVEIENRVSLIESFAPSILQVFDKINKKKLFKHRTASLYMRLAVRSYAKIEGVSHFDLMSPKIIENAVQKIRECSNNPIRLKACFQELLESFGRDRKEIARNDGTDESDFFGQVRNQTRIETPLMGRYGEYGEKLFNFFKNEQEKLFD
ncbi:MAG: hypothetical protein JSS09_03515, partial [Verrucomicrobia bacterium]|nr:hypothetical protein [Verrucomicrobiota bacterium]